MKKLLLLSAISLIAINASAAEMKPYIEGRINENFMKIRTENTDKNKETLHDNLFQGGSIEVGAKIDQFRIGLEGYCNDKLEDNYSFKFFSAFAFEVPVQVRTRGVFLNSYFDIPTSEKLKKVKPYIGVGIGHSWLKMSYDLMGSQSGGKEKHWGWNVGLGVAYELNDNVDLTFGYKYEDLGTFKKNEIEADFINHKVSLGLRYTF